MPTAPGRPRSWRFCPGAHRPGRCPDPGGLCRPGPNYQQLVECESGDTCTAEPIPLHVNLRPVEEVIAQVMPPTVASGAIATLVAAASDDVIRAALGEDPISR